MPTKVARPRRLVARRDRNYRNVMRPTRWGNPYPIGERMTRERSIALYREWLRGRLRDDPEFLEPLRGYHLGCTCAPGLECHADVLLEALYGRGSREAARSGPRRRTPRRVRARP